MENIKEKLIKEALASNNPENQFAGEIYETFKEDVTVLRDKNGNPWLSFWSHCPFCNASLNGTDPWEPCWNCGAT